VSPRSLSALASAILVLLLAGCAGGGTSQVGVAPSAQPVPATSAQEVARLIAAAKLPPCPETERAPASDGGLPDLTLDCLGEGPAVTLSGLRGTPLVVNVWASWCPPCAAEMPHLNAAHKAAGDRVQFLGVDLLDRRDRGLAWAKDFVMRFASVQDPDGVIRARMQVPAPPVTVFVRPDGQVTEVHYGQFRSEREVRAAIARHLGVRL